MKHIKVENIELLQKTLTLIRRLMNIGVNSTDIVIELNGNSFSNNNLWGDKVVKEINDNELLINDIDYYIKIKYKNLVISEINLFQLFNLQLSKDNNKSDEKNDKVYKKTYTNDSKFSFNIKLDHNYAFLPQAMNITSKRFSELFIDMMNIIIQYGEVSKRIQYIVNSEKYSLNEKIYLLVVIGKMLDVV